jgi:hypothetical protein
MSSVVTNWLKIPRSASASLRASCASRDHESRGGTVDAAMAHRSEANTVPWWSANTCATTWGLVRSSPRPYSPTWKRLRSTLSALCSS